MSKTDVPALFERPLVEVTISAPADEVWKALRDPKQIEQWFGWDTASLADEIEYIFGTHAIADEAAHAITFALRTDRIEVVAAGSGCVVRMVRGAPTADTSWDDVFDDEVQGWIAFVQQLAFAFNRHRGQQRRTLFFDGAPKVAVPTAVALGVPTTSRDAGTKVAFTSAPGDAIAGVLWHRGRHQVAVTVDAWGEGLLLVIDRPADEKRPNGTTQTILTTYGLDDAAFAALQQRWQSYWDQNYEASKAPGCE